MPYEIREHCRWWEITDNDELAVKIWEHLEAQQTWRRPRLDDVTELQHAYEREADVWDPAIWERFCEDFGLGEDAVPPCLNIRKAGIDTVKSRLVDRIPAVQCAPYNLPYELQAQQREMTDALQGTLNTDEAHDEIDDWVTAFLRDGLAFLWPITQDGRVQFQKLEYYECFWDFQDARKGKPRSFHVWLRVSKSELLAQWEEYRDAKMPAGLEIPGGLDAVLAAIKEMPEARPGDLGSDASATGGSIYEWRMRARAEGLYSITADQVHVVHSWHLPGGRNANDGLHVITIHPGGGVSGTSAGSCQARCILREQWTLPRFPVVWGSPYPHNEGIDGNGIGHLLRGQQQEVDRLADRVTTTSREIGRPHVIIDEAWEPEKEGIASQDSTNFIKIRSGGMLAAPIVWKPEPVSAQDLGLIDRYLGPWSLGLAGISTALAQAGSQLSANVSGIALVEENRKQDDRMAPVERQLRRFVRNLAEVTLDVIERAMETDSEFSLVWQDGQRAPRKTKWSEARLPREDYSVRLEETNIFGQSRGARIQKLIEMGDRYPQLADSIVPEILGEADLRKVSRYETAADRLVEAIVEQLVDVRQPEPSPDIHTPLELVQQRLLDVHRDASARGAKPETLLRIENYLAKAISKAAELSPPPMPGQSPIGGAPGLPMPAAAPAPGLPPSPAGTGLPVV